MGARLEQKRADFEAEALGHLDALYAAALRLTRAPSDADDLVQDTFVRAFRFYDRFEAGTNMKAWLLRIQTNTFINQYRRGQRSRDALEGQKAPMVGEGVMSRAAMRALSDPQGEADRGVIAREIEAAFDTLGDEARTMVMLADVQGLSYREIAEAVGCPIGTVMSRLHRARKTLQTRLVAQAIALGIVDSRDHDTDQNTDGALPVSLEDYRQKKAGA